MYKLNYIQENRVVVNPDLSEMRYYLNLSYENLPNEIWKVLPFFDNYFEISNLGRVRSLDREIHTKDGRKIAFNGKVYAQSIIKYKNNTTNDHKQELVCTVSFAGEKKRIRIHRMVYQIFIKSISFENDKMLVLHKDGNFFNNTCCNLYEATLSEKALQIHKTGRAKKLVSFHKKDTHLKSAISRSKTVSQYTLEGEKKALFPSIKIASLKTKISDSSIIAACKRKKLVSAGGYLWQYGNGNLKIDTSFYIKFIDKAKRKIRQKVIQYNIAGEKLRSYNSIKEAAEMVQTHPSNISNCVNLKVATSAGYIWRKNSGNNFLDVEDFNNIIANSIRSLKKPVYKICPLTKQILQKFESISEASKSVTKGYPYNLRLAANTRKQYKGFKWLIN